MTTDPNPSTGALQQTAGAGMVASWYDRHGPASEVLHAAADTASLHGE